MSSSHSKDASPALGNKERAYEAVALRELWGLLSLLFFVTSITTRLIVDLIPGELAPFGQLPPDPFLAVVLVPPTSILGLACALIAGRQRSATGRIGFFLNAIVLGLSLTLLTLVIIWWTTR